MQNYLHPGVYIEEIPSGSKPIEGVATSVAAFVGKATKGPVGEATLVQSFDDYNDVYGDIESEDDAMGLAVQSFYLNGGKTAFICRLAGDGSSSSTKKIIGQDTGALTNPEVLVISASSKGVWGNDVYFRIIKQDQDSLTFSLETGYQDKGEFKVSESFNNLSMRADDDNYVLTQVNGNSSLVELSLGDVANPEKSVEQYQAATLTGGTLDKTNNALFKTGIVGDMNMTLNINGLGAELITLSETTLALPGTSHNDDGNAVALAIKNSVQGLSLEPAYLAFDCQYNTTTNRFELTSAEDETSASLTIYDGKLAKLLRINDEQGAILTGGSVTGAANKFSNPGTGIPNLTQPMTLSLNIDNHGDLEISIDADKLTLIGDKTADGTVVARAIQDAVQLSNAAVAAYKDFKCDFVSNTFILTSGSGSSRASSLTVANGELAAFLKLQTTSLLAGRQVEQGTVKVIPLHNLGTQYKGIKLNGGSENDAIANDYTEFYNSVLRKVRDVSIVLNPGQSWADDGSGNSIISATLAHCNKLKSRVVIIDPPPNLELDQKATVDKLSLPSSTYSVLYYPWVKVANPFYNAETNPNVSKTIDVGPSSFAAGMWSRIDGSRGVWKAPAGMGAGLVGAAGLKYIIEDGEQDQLNPLGINCYRKMPGGGRVIWGSRTLATKADPEWRYVPVRRTAIMIEQSIYNGIQWAVFEPNDHRLWSALRGNIGGFMNSLFRAGAFQGEKASDAYFVRCGLGDTMTQTDIDAGKVIVTIGFAPLKPAEFVIVRIQQKVNQQ